MPPGQRVEVQVGNPFGGEMPRNDRHQRIAHRRRNPRVHAVRDDVVELPEICGEVDDVALQQLDVGESECVRKPPPQLDRPGRKLDSEKARIGKPVRHGDQVSARTASQLQHPAVLDRRGIQAEQPRVGRDAIGVRVLPRAAGIVDAVVERRGSQLLSRHSVVGSASARQGPIPPGAESRQYAPQRRAGIDRASSGHRAACMGKTLDLRLRRQRGERLTSTNTPSSGHGRTPGRLKCRSANLIRGRGPLQLFVFPSITPPTEHEYAAPWTRRGQVRLPWIQHSRKSALAVSG